MKTAAKIETAAEQRTRDWAAQHGKPREAMSELEIAGAEMREADERERLRRENSNLRFRPGREPSYRVDAGAPPSTVRTPM